MKHASTRTVFDYWNARRGNRPAPGRGDIDPVAIRHALGDTFMLATDFVDQLRFRLAGTRVCALFCREIKGEIFVDLWSREKPQADRGPSVHRHRRDGGAVAGLTGRAADGADGRSGNAAAAARPHRPRAHRRARRAGADDAVYWIGAKPIAELELNTVRHLGPEMANHAAAALCAHRPTAVELRHGFTVYSGGRDEPSTERSA